MVRARTRVGATVGATIMCVGGESGGGGGVRSARRLHLGELPGEVVGEGEVPVLANDVRGASFAELQPPSA